MKAREMFEELGFKLSIANEWRSTFSHADNKGQLFVSFCNTDKSVTVDYFVKRGGPNQERTESKLSMNLLSAIYEYCKELKWIEEKDKHFEEKQETNLEHYKDEIKYAGYEFALVNGKPTTCKSTLCDQCYFNDKHFTCVRKSFEWMLKPYKKSVYELTKFENDLLQSYLKSGLLSRSKFKSTPILNWMKEKGYFKGIDGNETVGDILANCEVIK